MKSWRQLPRKYLAQFLHPNPPKIAYIAGPITSDPDYKKKFDLAEESLKEAGYVVLNPAFQPKGLEYGQYIEISRTMLNQCNYIFLLENWESSPGARSELQSSLEREIVVKDFNLWLFNRKCKESEEREA